MTHHPSSTEDVRAEGAGLVPSAGRTGASSETLTDEQIAEWSKLCEEATEGPLKAMQANLGLDDLGDCVVVTKKNVVLADKIGNPRNAELFAASRTALPALIEEVKRLRLLLTACAPFDDAPDYGTLPDDAVVLRGNSEGLYITAGQVRAIKDAMGKVTEGAGE